MHMKKLWHSKLTGEDAKCELCNQSDETQAHILLECNHSNISKCRSAWKVNIRIAPPPLGDKEILIFPKGTPIGKVIEMGQVAYCVRRGNSTKTQKPMNRKQKHKQKAKRKNHHKNGEIDRQNCIEICQVHNHGSRYWNKANKINSKPPVPGRAGMNRPSGQFQGNNGKENPYSVLAVEGEALNQIEITAAYVIYFNEHGVIIQAARHVGWSDPSQLHLVGGTVAHGEEGNMRLTACRHMINQVGDTSTEPWELHPLGTMKGSPSKGNKKQGIDIYGVYKPDITGHRKWEMNRRSSALVLPWQQAMEMAQEKNDSPIYVRVVERLRRALGWRFLPAQEAAGAFTIPSPHLLPSAPCGGDATV